MSSRLDKLHQLLEADPTDADVPYMIAQEHARSGEHDHACRWFDRCLELEPDYHYAYYHKARSLEAREEAETAAATLRAGLERAERAGAVKAVNEIRAALDTLTADA